MKLLGPIAGLIVGYLVCVTFGPAGAVALVLIGITCATANLGGNP